MEKSSMNIAIKHFEALTAPALYGILQLRQIVFVVEQKCIFLDADGKDESAFHAVVVSEEDNTICGCLRIIPPERSPKENCCIIGRVVVAEAWRRRGLARKLMIAAEDFCMEHYPKSSLYLSAQYWLRDFYSSLGYEVVTEIYDEDGIPHCGMIKKTIIAET